MKDKETFLSLDSINIYWRQRHNW